MKKKELLDNLDDELLDKLFTFCYARTNDSYEAQELCSDIVFALVKAAHTDGEIASLYPFIWRVARNVYADFSQNRRKKADTFYDGNAEDVLRFVPDQEQGTDEDESDELLKSVYRRIAFLTKAYREVMILYYIDGLSTAEIAARTCTSEGAVRQRLFSARQTVKNEIEREKREMPKMDNRPLALDKSEYVILGAGNTAWGDPRSTCTRMLSRHMIWLCRKKPMRASEIAAQLNVPTVYVEEELEILAKGANGEYGLLRRTDGGRYAINFILFDKETIENAQEIYTSQLPHICGVITDYIEAHKEEYLSFPYLNHRVDFNLILWQQVFSMAQMFRKTVEHILEERYFSQTEKVQRPFSVFGHVDNGKQYGCGLDGAQAANVCGYSEIYLENIYITRIKKHFGCDLNVSHDPKIQLALRAIDGLQVSALSETEKEHAAKAIACGYLYREGDILYTKILVNAMQDFGRLFEISEGLLKGYFEKDAATVAERIATLIYRTVPQALIGEWRFANCLAGLPVADGVVETLIAQGILTPPKDGIGAEGCWMSVAK